MQCKMRLNGGYNMKYAKYSTNGQRPLMKHVKKVKIRLSLGLQIVQKWKHNGLPKHARKRYLRRTLKQVQHGGLKQG